MILMRLTAAALCLLLACAPAFAAAGRAAAPGLPTARGVQAAAVSLRSFFRSPKPDPVTLRPALLSLATADLEDADTAALLAPILDEARLAADDLILDVEYAALTEAGEMKLAALESAFGAAMRPHQRLAVARLAQAHRSRLDLKLLQIEAMVREAQQGWRKASDVLDGEAVAAGPDSGRAADRMHLAPSEPEEPEARPRGKLEAWGYRAGEALRDRPKARAAIVTGIVGALLLAPAVLKAHGVEPLPSMVESPFLAVSLAAAITWLIDVPLMIATSVLAPKEMTRNAALEDSPAPSLLVESGVILLWSAGEEFVFRFLLFGGLLWLLTAAGASAALAFAPAALASSLLFAWAHGYGTFWDRVGGGVLYSGLYFLSGELWWPILVHFLLNFTLELLGRAARERD